MTVEKEINRLHKDVAEIKESLAVFMESYVEMAHSILEKDRDKFISLDTYKKKHGARS